MLQFTENLSASPCGHWSISHKENGWEAGLVTRIVYDLQHDFPGKPGLALCLLHRKGIHLQTLLFAFFRMMSSGLSACSSEFTPMRKLPMD